MNADSEIQTLRGLTKALAAGDVKSIDLVADALARINRFNDELHCFITVSGDDALAAAKTETTKPTLVIFRTVIGRGAPTKSGTSSVHGSRLGSKEATSAKAALDLPEAPFEIANDVLEAWREVGSAGRPAREAWQNRVDELSPDFATTYARRMSG